MKEEWDKYLPIFRVKRWIRDHISRLGTSNGSDDEIMGCDRRQVLERRGAVVGKRVGVLRERLLILRKHNGINWD